MQNYQKVNIFDISQQKLIKILRPFLVINNYNQYITSYLTDIASFKMCGIIV